VRGEDLHLRVRDGRRAIALPASLVGRPLESARLQGGTLVVSWRVESERGR
jgi:hypothetical protein